jgi:hypothetical protein
VKSSATVKPELQPIGDDDVHDVATYLHECMNAAVSVDSWAGAMRPSWQRDESNHGMLLRRAGEVVGAYVALYSLRAHGVRCCNLGAWCVDTDVRFSSTRLLRALLDQDEDVFVDLSPSGAVVPLNERFGFRHLDTSTALITTLDTVRCRCSVTSDLVEIEAALTGADLEIFVDHLASPAVRHVLLDASTGTCHVMYRRDRRKGLPLFASVLHVSDSDVFASALPVFNRHLFRKGIPMLLCEERIVGARPRLAFTVDPPRPKMFFSDTVGPSEVDNLYSELTELAW